MTTNDLARSSLTDRVTAALTQTINSGRMNPGDQLPTGQQLATQYGVSLSVIREAISSLRAEGLVESRQGAGVFVAPPSVRRPFRIHGSAAAPQTERRIFELRMGVEVTAAGLAAKRHTKAQLRELNKAHAAMVTATELGESAVEEDLAFHRALATATGNSLFVDFITFLAGHIRDGIRASRKVGPDWEAKLVLGEHAEILAAIAAGNASKAQAAMTRHMENCLSRCG